MSKKYDFSQVFTKKDFADIQKTMSPKLYSELYKLLKFPRDDYVMQAKITKRKKEK